VLAFAHVLIDGPRWLKSHNHVIVYAIITSLPGEWSVARLQLQSSLILMLGLSQCADTRLASYDGCLLANIISMAKNSQTICENQELGLFHSDKTTIPLIRVALSLKALSSKPDLDTFVSRLRCCRTNLVLPAAILLPQLCTDLQSSACAAETLHGG
jgi:hypothetical protein